MPYWIRLHAASEQEDEVATAIALYDPAGIEQNGGEITAWFPTRAKAERCRQALPWECACGERPDENWNELWQSQWQPILIGKRWFLAPPWDPVPAPSGRTRLDLHPGTAFGNGDHPATHLCLQAMEELLRPGDRFLDVGCGSGLLCQAAAALGASLAAGCDLDPAAVAQTRSYGVNATWIGSTNAIAEASFDVLTANLPAAITIALFEDLRRIAKPGARLTVSGLLEEQLPAVKTAASGFDIHCERERGEWRSLELVKVV